MPWICVCCLESVALLPPVSPALRCRVKAQRWGLMPSSLLILPPLFPPATHPVGNIRSLTTSLRPFISLNVLSTFMCKCPSTHPSKRLLAAGINISQRPWGQPEAAARAVPVPAGSQWRWLCVSAHPSSEPAALPTVCWSGVGRGPSGWAEPPGGGRPGHLCCWHCWKAGLQPPNSPVTVSPLPARAQAWEKENPAPVSGFGEQSTDLLDGGESICIFRLDQRRTH